MLFARVAVSSALLLLTGCATIDTADGRRLRPTSAEFRAYVERVFREQNRVADELAFALEGPGADQPLRAVDGTELAAAEQRLLDACAGLNELATTRRDGQRFGLRRGLNAARTVTECEEETRSVARLLTPLER
jgi:hypothetical protein